MPGVTNESSIDSILDKVVDGIFGDENIGDTSNEDEIDNSNVETDNESEVNEE